MAGITAKMRHQEGEVIQDPLEAKPGIPATGMALIATSQEGEDKDHLLDRVVDLWDQDPREVARQVAEAEVLDHRPSQAIYIGAMVPPVLSVNWR